MSDEKKVNWQIQGVDEKLKNNFVAEAKLNDKNVGDLMNELLQLRYAKTKFVTS